MKEDPNCDPETDICSPADLGKTETAQDQNHKVEIIYVGDPMCSWCWGIAPELKHLRNLYKSEGIPFKIVVGGLRPGGGAPWNDQMKDFLKHHWKEVHKRSGQHPLAIRFLSRTSLIMILSLLVVQ